MPEPATNNGAADQSVTSPQSGSLPVMSDPDCQITAIECYAGWDIAEWCRWSITTTDAVEDDPTLYVVVACRDEQFVRAADVRQLRELAANLTMLADHVEAVTSDARSRKAVGR